MKSALSTSNRNKYKSFYGLSEDLRVIQNMLKNKVEAKIPCLISGKRYVIWHLKNQHYHPLLNKFPEGFLLIHLCPEFLLRDGKDEDDTDKDTINQTSDVNDTKINQQEFYDYITNECRLPLIQRFYSPFELKPKQDTTDGSRLFDEDPSIGDEDRLMSDDSMVLIQQDSVEHCGEELISASLLSSSSSNHSYLLHRGFCRSHSSSPFDNSDEYDDQSLLAQLLTHRDTANNPHRSNNSTAHKVLSPSNNTDINQRNKSGNQSDDLSTIFKPFFDYALLEHRLMPIPKFDISIITMLINRQIRMGRMTLCIPIVFLINDRPPELWPIYEHLKMHDIDDTEQEDGQGLNELKDFPSDEKVSDQFISSKVDIIGDTTPALIRYSNGVSNLQDDTDSMISSNSEESSKQSKTNRTGRLRRWEFFSRRTHCVLYSSAQHRKSLQQLLKYQSTSSSSLSTSVSSSGLHVETPRGAVIHLNTDDEIDQVQAMYISVPVLAQFSGIQSPTFLEDNEPKKSLNKLEPLSSLPLSSPSFDNSKILIGDFVLRLLPLRFSEYRSKTFLTSATERFTLVPSDVKDLHERVKKQQIGGSAQLEGELIGSWRYDVINGGLFNKVVDLGNKEDRLMDLIIRKSTRSLPIVRGPIVSIATSWPITDLWRGSISPTLPSPIPDIGKVNANVTFRTGAGPDSFLFWLWTDLHLLYRLRGLRQYVNQHRMNDENDSQNSISDFLTYPLHPPEEFDVIDSISSVIDQNKENNDGSEISTTLNPLLKYQSLTEGNLVFHAKAFLDTERKINTTSILRRQVGRSNDCHEPPTIARNNPAANPPQNELFDDLKQDDIKTSLAETEYLTALHPPSRTDRDFSDRLWQFIRRGHSFGDMYESIQLILDCITAAATTDSNIDQISNNCNNVEIQRHQRRSSRTSVLGLNIQTGQSAVQPTIQPLWPIVRSESTTKLSEFIRLVIRICQLRRYHQRNNIKHNQSSDEGEENLLIKLIEQMNQLRTHYKDSVACIDLIIEIAIHCLTRDIIQLIQQADPSITLEDLEWFTSTSVPIQNGFARLSRLHKISELAVLAQNAHLPWDPTRILLRHALDVYKSLRKEDDPGAHPLFIVGLNSQTTRALLDHWSRRIPPSEFSLKLGQSIEALFELNQGDHDLREIKDLYETYPKESHNEISDELSQHPAYIWRSWFHDGHQRKRSNNSIPNKNQGDDQHYVPLTYTLTLKFDRPYLSIIPMK